MNDLRCCGYQITRWIETSRLFERSFHQFINCPEENRVYRTETLPPKILSITKCISYSLPGSWCIEWTNKLEEEVQGHARVFGLNEKSLSDLTAWVTSRYDQDFGWENVCFSLEAARTLIERFLPSDPDHVLIGIGLPSEDVSRFVKCATARAGLGTDGAYRMILRDEPPETGGVQIGFDVMAIDETCLGCGWLCGGSEREFAERFGIRPNSFGLISTLEEARTCVDHLNREDSHAKPGDYFPWATILYPEK